MEVVKEVVRSEAREDDRNGGCEDFEDIVCVFDYHGNAQPTKRLQSDHQDDVEIVALDKAPATYFCSIHQEDSNESQNGTPESYYTKIDTSTTVKNSRE